MSVFDMISQVNLETFRIATVSIGIILIIIILVYIGLSSGKEDAE